MTHTSVASATEYDCLNHIRYGMKLWLRWGGLGDTEYTRMWAAMSYIEDVLWAELSRNTVKLTSSHSG